jgi:16S rRNA (adenine1518-N6/adenine1519-N6)-dimethyltransferase
VGARLGQHFLSDPSILGRIADAAGLTPGDTVLEIGPGKGGLTLQLAARAGRVVAIEADGRLAAGLRATLAGAGGTAAPQGAVEVVHGDALRVPWPSATCVCGNIPYRITSPLIERALTPPRPRRIVFLVQREVADRLAAAPGTRAYGALSAGVQLVATVERLFGVPRGAFRPPPQVESAVVRIEPIAPEPLSRDAEAATRRLIRLAFQRRRQQLRRILSEFYEVERAEAEHLLVAIGSPPDARPEVLSPLQFADLARRLADAGAGPLAGDGRAT